MPRSPEYPVADADDVGTLVAEAVAEGRFLVLTAPGVHDEVVERALDIETYLAKMTEAPIEEDP
jgi:hypothetical protein